MPIDEVITTGMIGIDDRIADVHPQHWDRKVARRRMRVAPIHTMAMGAGVMKTDSRIWNWFEMQDASYYGDVTDVYSDAGLSAVYSSGGVNGTPLFLKMSAAHAKQVIAGDNVQVVDTVNSAFRAARVTSVVINGASSYLAVTLKEADTDAALGNATLQFMIVGGGGSEGSGLRQPLFREPTKFSNCYQRFDTAWEFTNDEARELLRIDFKVIKEAWIQARERIEAYMDRAFIFQAYSAGEDFGENGKPIYLTRGLKNAIATYESQNFYDFSSDSHAEIGSEFDGVTWVAGGIPWLEAVVEIQRRRAKAETLTCFTSSYAIRMIQKAVRGLTGHSYEFSSRPNSLGLNIKQLDCPAGSITFHEHPDFTQLPFLRQSALIVEKGQFKLREFEGLRMIKPSDLRDNEDGNTWTDSRKGGLMKKAGLSWTNLQAFAWIDNIGDDNS